MLKLLNDSHDYSDILQNSFTSCTENNLCCNHQGPITDRNAEYVICTPPAELGRRILIDDFYSIFSTPKFALLCECISCYSKANSVLTMQFYAYDTNVMTVLLHYSKIVISFSVLPDTNTSPHSFSCMV